MTPRTTRLEMISTLPMNANPIIAMHEFFPGYSSESDISAIRFLNLLSQIFKNKIPNSLKLSGWKETLDYINSFPQPMQQGFINYLTDILVQIDNFPVNNILFDKAGLSPVEMREVERLATDAMNKAFAKPSVTVSTPVRHTAPIQPQPIHVSQSHVSYFQPVHTTARKQKSQQVQLPTLKPQKNTQSIAYTTLETMLNASWSLQNDSAIVIFLDKNSEVFAEIKALESDREKATDLFRKFCLNTQNPNIFLKYIAILSLPFLKDMMRFMETLPMEHSQKILKKAFLVERAKKLGYRGLRTQDEQKSIAQKQQKRALDLENDADDVESVDPQNPQQRPTKRLRLDKVPSGFFDDAEETRNLPPAEVTTFAEKNMEGIDEDFDIFRTDVDTMTSSTSGISPVYSTPVSYDARTPLLAPQSPTLFKPGETFFPYNEDILENLYTDDDEKRAVPF